MNIWNLDGKVVAEEIYKDLDGTGKKLTIVTGDTSSTNSYLKSIISKCKKFNIETEVIDMNQYIIEPSELKKYISHIINPVIIVKPYPTELANERFEDFIIPQYDVDCSGVKQLSRLLVPNKDVTSYMPCTVEAILKILDYYNIDVEGKFVTVIGRSLTVGKPLALALTNRDATVALCHSRTSNIDLHNKCIYSDIVISAIGKPNILTKDYFNMDTVVIDAGINILDGKIVGDVDYDNVCKKVNAITPVPGGVGPVTTAVLIEHICKN